MRLRRADRGTRRAAAATELALLLPVLLLMLLGAVDFGRFAYSSIAVTNAARAGGAYAIMNPFTPSTKAAWMARVEQAARTEMTGQTGFVATDLTVTTTPLPVEPTGLRRVRVEASYPFRTLVDWPGIPSEVTLRPAVEMRVIR
jgi:Flp pilus assembly protein TadG